MSTVTPIEPHLRRRDAGRLRTDTLSRRSPDRGVAIPVHREGPRVVATEMGRVAPHVAPAAAPLTERALAMRFFPLAALVVVADLATKAWATSALAERSVNLANGLSLALAYNRASAGGVSLGAHTREINFVATGVVVGLLVMIVPALTKLHRHAWIAAALIAGAGLGNLVSLASDSRGVADFIAFHGADGAWVLNVADLALVTGLAFLSWTVFVLAGAVRRGEARVRV